MSGKSKIADEEIRKYINEGMSNAKIAKALGTSQPNINSRCNKLRKEYGELLPDPEQNSKPKEQQAEPPETKPFPFEPKESVIHATEGLCTVRSVGKDRMILCRNANMQGITIMREDYFRDANLIRKTGEKPPIKTAGEDMVLKRRREDEEPNVGDIKVSGTPIKDLLPNEKKKIVEKLKEEIDQDPPRTSGNIFKAMDEAMARTEEAIQKAEVTMPSIGLSECVFSELLDTKDSTNRDYLNKIDQLLDLMAPMCSNKDVTYKTKGLAISILVAGIDGEARA